MSDDIKSFVEVEFHKALARKGIELNLDSEKPDPFLDAFRAFFMEGWKARETRLDLTLNKYAKRFPYRTSEA